MLNCFRGVYTLYLVLSIAGIFFIAGFAMCFQTDTPENLLLLFLVIVIMFVWIVLSALICNIIADRRFKNILAFVDEECDPGRYIAAIVPVVQRAKRRNHIRTSLEINLAMGLIEDGRIQEALALMHTVVLKRGRIWTMQRAVYLNNMCTAFIYIGDIDSARRTFEGLVNLPDVNRLPKLWQQRIAEQRLQKKLQMQMAEGNFDGAQLLLNEMFQNAKERRKKIYAQYYLGLAFLHECNREKAREALSWAAENGNKLYIARLAREKLGELA